MAVPNLTDLINLLEQYKIRSNEGISNILKKNELRLNNVTSSFALKNPLNLYAIKEQRLDNLIDNLNKSIQNKLHSTKLLYSKVVSNNVLKNPYSLIEKKKNKFDILLKTIEVLNPLKLLDSGYSIVKLNGKVITDINLLNNNDIIDIDMHNGIIKASVLERNDYNGKE